MNSQKNTVYLSISSFNIAISFEKTKDLRSEVASRRLKQTVKKLYKKYIIKKSATVDFSVDIKNISNNAPLLKKGSLVYGFFFKKESEKRYSCASGITIFQFSLVLRRAILTLLQSSPGFMIHSSSAEIDGKAFVFVGKSGAGKTTTMRLLSRKFKPLGDDSSVIKKENGKFYSYQSPLFENDWPIERSGKRYKFGKVIFLKKSKEFKLEKIKNKASILERLTKQLVCEEEKLQLYLPHLFDFTNNFDDFYILHFDKKPGKLISLLENS